MTIFLEPRTLHFGDTIATLAYVRADVPLRDNVVAIATAARLMHGAYARYAGERAQWLRGNPNARGAGEADALAATTGLPPRDVRAVFNFAVARAAIDRPVLAAVLAQAWLCQRGRSEGEGGPDDDGDTPFGEVVEPLPPNAAFEVASFLRACEWGAAAARD